MTMKLKTVCNHSIEIDGTEYELRLNPDHVGTIQSRKLDDGRMVIGYLIQDLDCANPCEDCDGMGQVRSLNSRHIDSIDHDEALQLLKDDKMVVPLSYFEHGNCIWAVGGTISHTPDFCWDGVAFAGVWIPDASCRDEIKSRSRRKKITYNAAARELAKTCCEEYTAWSNGDCWGVIIVTCAADGKLIDSDECWGHIGSEYAEKEVKDRLASAS